MNPMTDPGQKKIIVLASGRGSNFQAIIDALESGDIPATCIRLITDNPFAYAIERAQNAGIPVSVVDFEAFPSKTQYEEALLAVLAECNPDLILLAGYMRIVGPDIVRRFRGRIINIHPALLPSFPGLHGQRQAVDYGVKVSGCTVHFVDEQMDSGPIIVQACVPVLPGDDEDTLAERILHEEHLCFPRAVKLFCTDRLRIRGRVVEILE
ncbi:MAG TPA: phosphoribosylglycinamide formyltransferase [Methanoregulaceae archaeon]|nr:phosphoribosylglycinamide formyltransferase [Methanoregulaceae archaeon]